jgi:hypothetical protein
MKILFYALQTDVSAVPTTEPETYEQLLFTQEWGMLMTGQQINHAGTIYRVDKTEWINQKEGILKAVCLEVPVRVETQHQTSNTI